MKMKYLSAVLVLLSSATVYWTVKKRFLAPTGAPRNMVTENYSSPSLNEPEVKKIFSSERTDQAPLPVFQPINHHQAWVFSAFYDTDDSGYLLRVFGIQDHVIRHPVICLVMENGFLNRTEGHRTLLEDYFQRRFRIVSYECYLTDSSRPSSVSLTFHHSDRPTNHLDVVYSPSRKRNFTVCHSVLFGYDNHRQIIQNIEFNRVLGAEHFFVYNHSVLGVSGNVLRHYQQRGLLTLIQWPIPVKDIHYYGQILAINDCVYRNRGVSRFVVVKDTDELIIPYHHGNWRDLIDEMDRGAMAAEDGETVANDVIGTYIFESTFFQEISDDAEKLKIWKNFFVSVEDIRLFEELSLTAFTNLRRLRMTFGRRRTKVIVRPERVLFSNIHHTTRHRASALNYHVWPWVALVHHQRKWKSSDGSKVIDPSTLMFKDKVIPNIQETYTMLRHAGVLGIN